MIIANPLYDVVFKYLLEDIDIARELLSTILVEDIVHLEVKPQDVKEEFVELLTHDSYVIQVRLLPQETKTKLERILQIFNPRFKTSDKHKLNFTGNTEEPIVQKMLSRLQRAIADEEMRHQMDVEDEIERVLARQSREKDQIIAEQGQALVQKDEVIAKTKQELEETKQVVAKKDEVIAEKDQALEVERQKNEDLLRQIAAFQKQAKK